MNEREKRMDGISHVVKHGFVFKGFFLEKLGMDIHEQKVILSQREIEAREAFSNLNVDELAGHCLAN